MLDRNGQLLRCRMLIEEHYPWFLETYDSLPQNIMRADAVRTTLRSCLHPRSWRHRQSILF